MSQVATSSAPQLGTLVLEHEAGINATWLHASGELDLATAPQLEEALDAVRRDSLLVVLEPQGLTFIDCAGLRVIIDAAARARSRHGWLLLIASSPVVERLLTLTGRRDLVTVFDFQPDPELGRQDRLEAVQDSAEALSPASGARKPAWSRPPPGRDHATQTDDARPRLGTRWG